VKLGAAAFLVGLALGVALATFGPPAVQPYLPAMLQGKVESVEGQVARKQREDGRLLLTLVTPRGAILAIFTKKVPEVDLLIAEGDTVTLGLRRVEPFVNDPTIQSVRKTTAAGGTPSGTAGSAASR
jgi:hypothetical protein